MGVVHPDRPDLADALRGRLGRVRHDVDGDLQLPRELLQVVHLPVDVAGHLLAALEVGQMGGPRIDDVYAHAMLDGQDAYAVFPFVQTTGPRQPLVEPVDALLKLQNRFKVRLSQVAAEDVRHRTGS